MPQEAKVKFMQELKGKHGAEAVLAHAIDTLKSYERTTERYAFNGEFRPLEFWRLKPQAHWLSTAADVCQVMCDVIARGDASSFSVCVLRELSAMTLLLLG